MLLLTPIVTETAYAGQSLGKYYFWVDPKSTKTQIASAFFNAFKVKPTSVNTIQVRGKIKTNWKTRQSFSKPLRKKAIVTIEKGTTIAALNLSAGSGDTK